MRKYFIITVLTFYAGFASAQQSLYDKDSITIIELTFFESDWDALMDTYKSNSNDAEESCDHSYVDERALAKCVVNGVEFDSVGVKYKGNSTYGVNNSKNPLNIKLNYTQDLEYLGYTTLKLSNIAKDPSLVREVLSYDILRDYMDAPKSNFALVYINGDYYGLFSSSESISKDFCERKFDYSKTDARIKCNAAQTQGSLQPSLSYISNDSTDYYCSYQIKSDYGWTELAELINTLNNNEQELESILDIDRAIWMLAFNNVLVNLDSYSGGFKQNYYLVEDKNNRFCPVVWDLNESFGGFTNSGSSSSGGGRPGPGGGSSSNTAETDLFLHESDDGWPLLQVILSNERYRKMYIAHCKTMMEEHFVSGAFKDQAAYFQALIEPYIDSNVDGTTYNSITQNIESSVSNTIGLAELMDARNTYYQSIDEYVAVQPTVTITNSPDTVSAFSTVTVTATIENANYAYLGYRHSADDIFIKIDMTNTGGNVWEATFDVDEKNTHYYIYSENADAGIFSPQRAEHEYHKIYGKTESALSQDIVINEFVASNFSTQADEAGEFDDWIELYNNTDEAISLLGYYMTDNVKEPLKWSMPDTTIPAKGYIIVWADEDGEQGEMHANFKLSASGEEIALVNSKFAIVDSISYSTQITDAAYARVPNGTGEFKIQMSTFSTNNNFDDYIYQTISLVEGWNLVSIGLIPVDSNIPALFPNATIVKNDNEFWNSSYPDFLNSLTSIETGNGYMVYNTKTETIEIAGYPMESEYVLELENGWNIMGVPTLESKSISDFSLMADFEIIKDFDLYNDNTDNSSLQNIETSKAYFIKINEDSQLIWE